jgi:hypothetical protein
MAQKTKFGKSEDQSGKRLAEQKHIKRFFVFRSGVAKAQRKPAHTFYVQEDAEKFVAEHNGFFLAPF